jgi:hypothetical protein
MDQGQSEQMFPHREIILSIIISLIIFKKIWFLKIDSSFIFVFFFKLYSQKKAFDFKLGFGANFFSRHRLSSIDKSELIKKEILIIY